MIDCEVVAKKNGLFKLPKFRFMSQFSSIPLESHLPTPMDSEFDASFLTVIWLQDDLHPLVSPQNVKRITALNWTDLSVNGHW